MTKTRKEFRIRDSLAEALNRNDVIPVQSFSILSTVFDIEQCNEFVVCELGIKLVLLYFLFYLTETRSAVNQFSGISTGCFKVQE